MKKKSLFLMFFMALIFATGCQVETDQTLPGDGDQNTLQNGTSDSGNNQWNTENGGNNSGNSGSGNNWGSSGNGGSGTSNPVTNTYSALSQYWGKWIRVDNGETLYVKEKSVVYGSTENKYTSSNSSYVRCDLGTISKESENVLKLNNIPMYRATGSNVEYRFTLVGFASSSYSTATNLGAGCTVTATNADFPSYIENAVSDENGVVVLHSPVAGSVNKIVARTKNGDTVTATLTPMVDGEDCGTLAVVSSGKYSLKITGVTAEPYFFIGNTYNLKVRIENITDVIASTSVVTIESEDSKISLSGSTTFNIASFRSPSVKEETITVRCNATSSPFVYSRLKVTFTDARTYNTWIDYIPIRFHSSANVNINTENTEGNYSSSLNGYFMYPDGSGQYFKVKHGYSSTFQVPVIPSVKDYKVVFGGAVLGSTLSSSTEMKYSLGLNSAVASITAPYSLSEINFGEYPDNNREDYAYEIQNNRTVKAYLGYEDVDFYRFSLYSSELNYTVNHYLNSGSGYKLYKSETKTGNYGSYTYAQRDSYLALYCDVNSFDQVLLDNWDTLKAVNIYYDYAVLTGIEISANPTRTNYFVGDDFDGTGLVVKAVYNDGTKNVLSYGSDGYTLSGFSSASAGSKTVTVSYTAFDLTQNKDVTKTASFTVNVTALVVNSISIITKPAKLNYYVGDSLDATGMIVKATYNSGETETVTDYTTNYSFTSSGTKTVTVSYGGKSATFSVTVTALSVNSIEVTTKPTKLSYYEGDSFDKSGMVVKATYNSGKVETVTGYTVDYNFASAGTKTVTVSYGGKNASFNVTVIAVALEAIKISKMPKKLIYTLGETFDTTGMVVTGINNNGSTFIISDYDCNGAEIITTVGKNKTVTVSYSGKIASFNVTVNNIVSGIAIEKQPDLLEYCIGESIDITGMVVKSIYIDGSEETVTDYTLDYNFDSEGTKTVTVSYEGKTAIFTVEVIDLFYSQPVMLPFGTDGSVGTSGTYCYFGAFPRTVKSDSVTVDETDTITMGANTYYKGSDRAWYAKAKENAYGTYSHYKYTDGTQVARSSENSYRYFKVEPIKWRVVTQNYNNTGKALLLAEDVLTANVPYYKCNSSENTRTVGSDTNIYPNNYKYSQIRAYLNGLDYYYDTSSTKTTKKIDYTGKGFLQIAFTSSAQGLIAVTTVYNSGASTTDYTGSLTKADGTYQKSDGTYPYPDYTCSDTSDKVFLLSEYEVTNTTWGFTKYNEKGEGNSRIRMPTDYALANYAIKFITAPHGSHWLLRSPYYSSSILARCVGYADGSNRVDDSCYGVVPALCVDLP